MATKMTPKELKVIKLRKINFRAKSNMAAGCRACIRVGIQRVKLSEEVSYFGCRSWDRDP